MTLPQALLSSYATWTPAQITTGLWLDADDASTFTYSSGVVVSQWNDKSGNARHNSQSTGSLQPTRQTSVLNSRAVVRFDTDDYLVGASFMNGKTLSIVAVAKRTTDNNVNTLISAGKTGGSDARPYEITFRNSFLSPANNLRPSPAQTGTTWLNGSTSSLDLGASPTAFAIASNVATNTVSITSSNTETRIGGYLNNATPAVAAYQLRGDIAEIVVVESSISDAVRQQLEGYMAWKWGLQSSLPSGHPYKNGPP